MFYEESTFEDEYIVLKYKDILKRFLKIKMLEESIGNIHLKIKLQNLYKRDS